jgi:outer membrane receptor protein involved in Fe transport|tara:strand:- start:32 stop:2938 length:2907 start_codon:yes stop_codon:yes gene_type:complete
MKSILNIICILILHQILFGGTTGKLSGTLIDKETGEPLIGCNIIIEDTYLGTSSNEKGEYALLNIPPNTYSIRFEMIGYKKLVNEGVTIISDKTTSLNGELVSSVIAGEEVVVVAEKKLIQFDVTQSEAIISSEELEGMPVTEVSEVLRLQGGVTVDSDGGIHMRGGRTSEVSYMVDGVPMSDLYDGGIGVQIENDNIQELQVISGTFNAEYGRALTGVVNMVTKDGGNQFEGSLHTYAGDYQSSDKIYNNLNNLDLEDDYSVSASLSGPILKDKVTFYSSGRVNQSKGWLNGLQTFTIYGDTIFKDQNNNRYLDGNEEQKDPYYKGLNWHSSWSTQNKVTFNLLKGTTFKINTILNSRESQDYNFALQLLEDAQITNFNRGRFLGLSISHTLSPTSFLQVNVSENKYNYESYLFEDPLDNRYITPDSLFLARLENRIPDHIIEQYGDQVQYFPAYSLYRAGVDNRRFKRETKTNNYKLDFTSQINKYNQVKLGLDFSSHSLMLDTYSLLDSTLTDQVYTPIIPDKESFTRSYYVRKPTEFAIYAQDKIEYGDMIINLGLRYESFNPNAKIPNNIHEPYIKDPRNPALDTLSNVELENINWGDISYTEIDSNGNEVSYTYADYYSRFNDQPNLNQKTGWWKNTTVKSLLSPRAAVAYPISDKGVIHFAYGYFFKIPDFSLLYDETDYKLSETGSNFGIFGNPDLEPETTVSYELGLKQEVALNTRLELKAFYRDARNYVSSGIPIDLGDGKAYYTFVNKDYSNSRGIIVTAYRRFSNFIGGQLDYTYQVAEGANSNPVEEFGAVLAGNEPTRSIIPLDWDQTHSLNGSIFANYKEWGANTVFQFGAGYPYTPQITNYESQGEVLSTVLLRNSRRKPSTFRVDVKLHRGIKIGDLNGKFYIRIQNLTDRRNHISVYGDSGKANQTIEQARAQAISPFEPMRPNTLEQFFNRPDWYDPPRQIQMGLQIAW